jgi:regulatory protein
MSARRRPSSAAGRFPAAHGRRFGNDRESRKRGEGGNDCGEGGNGTGRPDGGAGGPTGPADPVERAREICLRLLAVRPRTRAELASALRRRHIADEIAEAVLDRFDEVGMIDDTLFAQAWVTSRHHGRGLARRALGHELRRKGVDSATIGDALERLDPTTEEETARALVERRLRGIGAAPPDAVLRKLAGMLARKGYPPGLVFRVIRQALEARPEIVSFMDGAGADLDAMSHAVDADSVDPGAEDRYEPDT